MKDMTNIDLNTSYNWITDKIFQNKYSWESENVLDTKRHRRRILYAHYEKAELHKITAENEHLPEEDPTALQTLLIEHEFLFDRNLSTWQTKSLDIKLQLEAK